MKASRFVAGAALAAGCASEAEPVLPPRLQPSGPPLVHETTVRSAPSGQSSAGAEIPKGAPPTEPVAGAAGREPAMVSIPGGTYSMGSNDQPQEKPIHRVEIAAFTMDATEVTAGAFAECVRASGCSPAATDVYWEGVTPAEVAERSRFCTYGRADRLDHPINCVTWDHARSYCAWAGKRLPTEEEWEYAARGTDGRTLPWGSDEPLTQLCWRRSRPGEGTCAVGSFPAGRSPFGLSDMAGNVVELTASPYCPYTNRKCSETSHVGRGGSFMSMRGSDVRATDRGAFDAAFRNDIVGFRCAR